METEGPWCDNASCPHCGKIGADNIKMHSFRVLDHRGVWFQQDVNGRDRRR